MKLLMVNDAELELHSMEKEIPWDQYGIDKVYTAVSASQGREILSKYPIDILLCDIEMPGEDGISLIRWIRQNDVDTDCILLTCHADFAYAKEAINLNCKDYIVLPAKYEDIGENVLKAVHQRMKRKQEKELEEYGKNWFEQHREQVESENKAQTGMTPKETVQKCEAYIQEHLGDENLNVKDIGAVFYLNPIYLSKIFKKEKGASIGQWITRKRMELAAQLLRDPSLTAVSVASHCGYNNYPYFSTVFKNYYGCTPSQYAEKNTKK